MLERIYRMLNDVQHKCGKQELITEMEGMDKGINSGSEVEVSIKDMKFGKATEKDETQI